MSMQQHRRRLWREAQAPSSNGMVASRTKRKRSPCQQHVHSQVDGKKMYLCPSLPEDIWHHINSLMLMRDAARTPSVSRAFLHSWRCHPTLTFSNESLGLNKNAYGEDGLASVFNRKVGHILAMHSGIGLKTLQIRIPSYFSTKDGCYVDSWLQAALSPGIEELTLTWHPLTTNYNFPYSFLSNGSGESIRYIHLFGCSFHPAATLGSLRSLTRLHLCLAHITGEEVERLLCNSLALERLEVGFCNEIVCLKVPCILQRLSYLEVSGGGRLEAIDNEAPNHSSFHFGGGSEVRLSLGEALQMKRLTMSGHGSVFYACTKLPSMTPNLEALTLHSLMETITPMLCSKFLHRRHLSICIDEVSRTYDYLSLANFLDDAPCLESFHLDGWRRRLNLLSVFADPSDMRQMQGYRHHSLKSVRITYFCCVRSLVELTCHVVESATSLEFLTLDASRSIRRCSDRDNKSGKCHPMNKHILNEAHRAVLAVRRYIEPKVPSIVKLYVLAPSSCRVVRL